MNSNLRYKICTLFGPSQGNLSLFERIIFPKILDAI